MTLRPAPSLKTRKGRKLKDGSHSITVRRFGEVVSKVVQLPLWRPRA
jgi:hypothetical protein